MVPTIGIKISRWALVQIYSRDVGVCCQSWGRSFATNTLGEAINLHQCSVAGLNGYYSAFEWYKIILQLCGNDTKIMFSNGCSACFCFCENTGRTRYRVYQPAHARGEIVYKQLNLDLSSILKLSIDGDVPTEISSLFQSLIVLGK